jgi:hypothetical protein
MDADREGKLTWVLEQVGVVPVFLWMLSRSMATGQTVDEIMFEWVLARRSSGRGCDDE